MIDFHTHILPKVDDGSKSMKETLEILKEAKQAGFNGVISTAHYIENYYEENVSNRKELLDSISSNLKSKKIKLDLYLGNEVYFSDNILELLKKGEICTINNTKYILFELPMNIKPISLYDVVYEMVGNDFLPILAHPERYDCVQKNPELVCELIEKGVYMQSNYGSVIGYYGKKAQIIVNKLLKNDMVHFLGSDVHKPNTIYPKIPEALLRIEKLIGKEKLELLTNKNPQLVLQNKEIELEEPNNIKLSFIEKLIMKT